MIQILKQNPAAIDTPTLKSKKNTPKAEASNGGDMLRFRVVSGDSTPDFQPGDVLEIRPAAFTEDIQQRAGVVIRKEGCFILGHAVIEANGTGTLCSGATLIPFTEKDLVGYVEARIRAW